MKFNNIGLCTPVMQNMLNIRILLLLVIAIAFSALYLVINLQGVIVYIIERRIIKLAAMWITCISIGLSTLIFQTITQNRILTPNVIGLDSLYGLLQTFLLFLLGSQALVGIGIETRYLITIIMMVGFALLLYHFLFKRDNQNIYFLLLVGLVIGGFFSSVTTFLQVLIDPNEFQFIQDKSFASINNVNQTLLLISVVLLFINILWLSRYVKYLDVLSLGRDHAINLGVDYLQVVRSLLIIIVIFISIATALIGPITFFGLLAVSITYQLLPTFRHRYLGMGVVLIGFIAISLCQLVIEHILNFSTSLSVILNLIGGTYFIYLLIKGTHT